MQSLGIHSIIVGDGKSVVNGISIAGKGWVGLVFKARSGDGVVALKIRRADADRVSMDREAALHKIANDNGVGPKYIGHTKNLIAMEFVDGQSVIDWVQTATLAEFKKAAKSVLDQCYLLDRAGLDHGELSRLGRHVIVSAKQTSCIIDFESASATRKTSNVTSAAQSLFLFGAVANHSQKLTGGLDKGKVIALLRNYKKFRSEASYDDLVECLLL